jgi:hypothetical protein
MLSSLLLGYAFHMYYRCADKNSATEVERDGTICLHVGNNRSFQKEVTYFLG